MPFAREANESIFVNPAVRRLGEHDCHALLEDGSTVRLTADTFAFLERLRQPATLGAILPHPTSEQLQTIDQLFALRVLLRTSDQPGDLEPALRLASPTFAGAPDWSRASVPSEVVVLGAPSDGETLGCYLRGSARGPEAIRRASLRLPLDLDSEGRAAGFYDHDHGRPLLAGARIADAGDLIRPPGCAFEHYARALTATLREIRQRGALPVLLGGDHAVTLPAVRAIDAPAIGVIHVDAHSDLASARDATDVSHANVMRHVGALPGVRHILQLGLRGILPNEQSFDRTAWETWSVMRLREATERRLGALCRADLPYYLSIDIDALDPSVAPGTPAPIAEGFYLSELRRLLRTITRGRRLIGIDLVEVLPSHDQPPLTAMSAVQVLLEAVSAAQPG